MLLRYDYNTTVNLSVNFYWKENKKTNISINVKNILLPTIKNLHTLERNSIFLWPFGFIVK